MKRPFEEPMLFLTAYETTPINDSTFVPDPWGPDEGGDGEWFPGAY